MMPHIIMMKKIEKGNIFVISFMLLLAGIKGAAASLYQDISGIPIFIHFFLLINILQLSVAIVILQEVKKVSASPIWNNVFIANFFTTVDAITLAVILTKYNFILNIDTTISIALFYTIAVFMVITTEYLMTKPLLKEKMNIMRKQYKRSFTMRLKFILLI